MNQVNLSSFFQTCFKGEQSEEVFEKLKEEDKDEYLRPGCIGEKIPENDNEEDEDEDEDDKNNFLFENQPIDAKNFDCIV